MSSLLGAVLALHGWPVYLVVAAFVFGETALVLGLVLPGETAAILGGVLAARGHASPVLMAAVVAVAAVGGDSVGFLLGTRLRDGILRRWHGPRITNTIGRARELIGTYGGRVILVARFLPFVRTAMPDAAALARIRYRRYIGFSAVAAVVWAAACVLVGDVLGSVAVRLGGAFGLTLLVLVGLIVGVVLTIRHVAHRGRD